MKTLRTRPSALGMSDPICGPWIHNFGEGKYIFLQGEKNAEEKGGIYLEKDNVYFL